MKAPQEMMERLRAVMVEAWQSSGGMFIDTKKCQACLDHWHILICPGVREIMGGAQDGEQFFARFFLDVNKAQRAFDKRPEVFFDTAQGESVPHLVFVGEINGHQCELLVMSYPPTNLVPLERVYVEGPKKGTVEHIEDEAK